MRSVIVQMIPRARERAAAFRLSMRAQDSWIPPRDWKLFRWVT